MHSTGTLHMSKITIIYIITRAIIITLVYKKYICAVYLLLITWITILFVNKLLCEYGKCAN